MSQAKPTLADLRVWVGDFDSFPPRHIRHATVSDLIAALCELGAETVEIGGYTTETWVTPFPTSGSGPYLVFPLSNLEEQS